MANNRETRNSRRKVTTTYVGIDGTRITVTGYQQTVYSEPQRILKEKYLTPKGERLLKTGKITEKEAWKKYGKNRYIDNPNAKPVKKIYHE